VQKGVVVVVEPFTGQGPTVPDPPSLIMPMVTGAPLAGSGVPRADVPAAATPPEPTASVVTHKAPNPATSRLARRALE
jgi:hypothetical protein